MGAASGKAKDKWLIRVAGTLIDATHHVGTTSRAYLEASAMSINMGNARLNYATNGHEIPKVFLRGHRHVPGYFTDGAGLFAITGAWQALTRYGHKVVPDSMCRPCIYVLDWRGLPDNSIPRVHEIQYKPKQQEIYES
jgi:hypothetical protein